MICKSPDWLNVLMRMGFVSNVRVEFKYSKTPVCLISFFQGKSFMCVCVKQLCNAVLSQVKFASLFCQRSGFPEQRFQFFESPRVLLSSSCERANLRLLIRSLKSRSSERRLIRKARLPRLQVTLTESLNCGGIY